MDSQKKAQQISVRDANQGFSKMIARVQRGESFVVTKNGAVVARIEPADTAAERKAAQRRAAKERLERVMSGAQSSQGGWTFAGKREQLHERSE